MYPIRHYRIMPVDFSLLNIVLFPFKSQIQLTLSKREVSLWSAKVRVIKANLTLNEFA